MALERWNNPFRDLFSLRDRMNRMSDDVYRGVSGCDDMTSCGSWAPAVDVYEDGNNIYLEAELPGLEQKDIQIKIENNTLTLSGERKWEQEERKENYHRVERAYGSFARSFTVPSTIDAEKVQANYKSGLLKVTLPRKAESKPREISVNVSQ